MNVRNLGLVENWGPHVPYHAGNGLVLRLDRAAPFFEGGRTEYALKPGTPLEQALFFLENNLRQRVIGVGADLCLSEGKTGLPVDIVFRVQRGYVTSSRLGEDMLWRSQKIESCCRWLLSSSNSGPDPTTRSASEGVLSLVEDGRFGLSQLEEFVAKYSAAGLPVAQYFFLHNVAASFEDMRSALLRASHHATSMIGFLWTVNNHKSARELDSALAEKIAEIKHASETGDHVADEFTSAVVSTHSALDLLFRMFLLLVREPFGDPVFPKGLHFSDVATGKVWKMVNRQKASDLSSVHVPRAIPFLLGKEFDDLRKLRNDLVHNTAADDIRPQIYVGVGTPRIGGIQLQYAQYRTRDIDSHGNPIRHPWCARFYQQDRSADIQLHSWLLSVWETVNDTCDWIV